MIHIDNNVSAYDGTTMKEALAGAKDSVTKIKRAVSLVKTLPIKGCITGSVWLPNFDPDGWGSKPDVDVFVYSEDELVKAINIAEYGLKMKPGKGTDRSEKQERWKIDRLYESGLNNKIGITTYTFYCDGIMLNFTFKQKRVQNRLVPLTTAPDVLMSFDMSMVMQGYDIQSHAMFDLRPDNVPNTVAIPNPLRKQDCMVWTVSKWVRQFDRVVKYYERGYDTRPMAEFYIKMIDECMDAGSLFDSDNSIQVFESYASEFVEKRALIADWLEEHKED